MSEIRIKENESIDSALRRFKRSCAKAGTLSELRKREHYESPSVKRRRSLRLRARRRKDTAKDRFQKEQMQSICSFFLSGAPGGARFLRVRDPNPPGSGKDIAEGKGDHREVESEGSRMWGTY